MNSRYHNIEKILREEQEKKRHNEWKQNIKEQETDCENLAKAGVGLGLVVGTILGLLAGLLS